MVPFRKMPTTIEFLGTIDTRHLLIEDNKPKEKAGMNYSTAVMLINQKIRAIKTIYKPDVPRADGKPSLTEPRIIYKTLDPDIKKGDLVVVQTATRHNMTVVMVDEVDIDVDFDSSAQVGWVIDKVSKDGFNEIVKEEGKWIDALKASEKRKKRKEIKDSMLAMYDDPGIEKLPIANMSGSPAVIEVKEIKAE